MRNLTPWIRFCIALSALFHIATEAQAAIGGTASVEWLTCSSKIVAVGKISKITRVKGSGDVIYEDCILTVSESIKGNAGKEVGFCYRHFPEEEKSWEKPGQDLLVFLSAWKDRFTDEEARGGGFSDPYYEIRMHGKLVPAGGQSSFCIMTLSNLPDLFDKDMARITDRESVLGLCRKWATSPIVNSIQEVAPWDSEIQRKYYARSGVFFEVPAEEKHRVRFLKMAKSADHSEHATAAAELWKFPGNETEEALRSLLIDQSETIWYSNDTIFKIEYGVRSAAFRSLQQLGKPVEPLALERKPTVDEQRKYRQDTWLKSFKEALRDGWEVASIREGETRVADSREWTVVLIQLANGGEKCDLVLIPKELLEKNTAPDHEYLGINGRKNAGARGFYSHGRIPDSLKTRLVQSFGLVIE